jgi:hypothetical protein
MIDKLDTRHFFQFFLNTAQSLTLPINFNS